MQEDLSFYDSIKVTKNSSNIEMYKNTWKFTTQTFMELHRENNSLYISNTVAYGTFLALKSYYV